MICYMLPGSIKIMDPAAIFNINQECTVIVTIFMQ